MINLFLTIYFVGVSEYADLIKINSNYLSLSMFLYSVPDIIKKYVLSKNSLLRLHNFFNIEEVAIE